MDELESKKKAEESWKDDDFLTFGADGSESEEEESEKEKETSSKSVPSDTSSQKSKKRPRHEENQRQCFTSVSELPPWMDESHRVKFHRNVPKLVLLHDEIVSFAQLMAPQPDELEMRENLVNKVTDLIKEVFKGRECDVHVFGSQATGLLLPTSDIDFVVSLPDAIEDEKKEDTKNEKKIKSKEQKKIKEQKEMEEWESVKESISPLARIGEALKSHPDWRNELTYLEVVENTRVPIVKFTHSNGISVDICLNQTLGVQAAELMKRFLDAMAPLKALTFVLKYFMAARGLNEPYSGGCGSFMLQMMIVSYLQHRERYAFNFDKANTMNLGSMLLGFFELYGVDFNYYTTGISVRSDGFYFPKAAKGKRQYFCYENRPFSLALENPFEITADVGKASFRMQLIAKSFEVAMRVLLSHTAEPAVPTESILASIIPPTEEMIQRAEMLKVLQRQTKSRKRTRAESSESSMDTSSNDSEGLF